MNWTGGTLQRTKHANKGVVQKQKAYFARARTHLQDGPSQPAVPFRPTHLQDNNSFDLTDTFASIAAGSRHHTGPIARHGHEPTQRKSSLCAQSLQHGGELIITSSEPRPEESIRPLYRDSPSELQRKRKVGDTDPETQLLEANRKRLLTQHDWIGVAPSRPVNLRLLAGKEISKFGKRRKVDGRHGATARQRDDVHFVTQPLPAAGRQPVGGFVGAIRRDPDEIRIRIGTHALTMSNDDGHSHASSDLILFDQQARDAEQPVTHAAVQLDTHGAHPSHQLAIQRQKPTNYKDFPPVAGQAQHVSSSENLFQRNSPDDIVAHVRSSRQVSSSPEFVARISCEELPGSEDSRQGFRITQPFEGASEPLQLIFPASVSSERPCNRTVINNRGYGGTDHAPKASHAGESKNGYMRHVGGYNEALVESEAAAAGSIVDETPWRTFLKITEKSSSHSTTANDSEMGFVHQRPTTKTRKAECASWSQHTVQGDHTSSSSVRSASLPSLRNAQTCRSSDKPRTRRNCPRQTARGTLNEDERIWREFVLASSDGSSSQPGHDTQHNMDQRPWNDTSSYLPLSLAVSSIGSPFRPRSGRGSRMHHDLDHAARFAPSQSVPTTSPAAVGPEFFDDDSTAEHSILGESVGHASLQANASGQVGHVSSTFSNTETSRSGLEHSGHSGASLFDHRAQATRGEILGRRQTRQGPGSPVTDDEGLHLVDVD